MIKNYKFRTFFKWLYPGMRVKRWAFLSLLGLILMMVGVGGIMTYRGGLNAPIAVVYYETGE